MSLILSLCSLVPFYLLGALPTGKLIASRAGVDIRTLGSGNVGATNIARILGKKAGLFTLLVDIAKGWLGTYLALIMSGNPNYASAAALALVAGHCFSLPQWRSRGKGVATALGAFLILTPASALIAVAVFTLVFFIWRITSLASLCGVVTVPILNFLGTQTTEISSLLITTTCLLIIARHHENLRRLTMGQEEKMSFGKR